MATTIKKKPAVKKTITKKSTVRKIKKGSDLKPYFGMLEGFDINSLEIRTKAWQRK